MEYIYFISSRVYAKDFDLLRLRLRDTSAQHSTFRVHIRQPRHSTLYHPFIPITAMVQRGAPRVRKTAVRGRRRALRASVRT